MHRYIGITLLSLAMLCGCSRTVLVPVPPRMDLRGYGTLGIVEFASNSSGAINTRATRQFQEQIQAAQPDLIYANIFAADQINFVKQAQQVDADFFKKYPMTTLASVDELTSLGSSYPLNMHLYMRAPFFAIGNSRLDDFVNRYRSRYNEYPSDWAVMDYDAVQMWAKAANAAGSFDAAKVLPQIVGKSFQSLRGYTFTIRRGDQQANVGETIGTTGDSAGKFPFPVLKDSTNLKGDDLLMPTSLMNELRDGKCQTNNDVKTTDFALCPSWKA